MYHSAPQTFARLDPYGELLLPESKLADLREQFQARVNAGPRVAHAHALHPDLATTKGKVSLMRQSKNVDGEDRWETRVVSVGELATSDALRWATHISMQRFYGARGSTSLVQVNSLIADVDCHDKAAFLGLSPEEMAGILIERLRAAGKPLPSYIVFSGRGLHLVWLHQPLMATAGVAGRHRAVQRWLVGPKDGKPSTTVRTKGGTRLQDPEVIAHETMMAAVWKGTGIDRAAIDTARVLRLAGSYNGKSGKVARLVWPASWADVERHDFEDLAAAYLPFSRDEMACLKAERQAEYEIREAGRQARRAEAEAAGIPVVEEHSTRRISGGNWPSIVQALDAVRVWWGGTPPEGKRTLWAFLSACAIAQVEGGDAASWAAGLAGPASLPEGELRSSLGALERILRRHEAGETRDYKGVERPVMYVYARARMLTLLGLSEDDARAAGADALLPGGVVRTEKQRSAERRADAGATPRTVVVSARLADGREALALQAAGKTMREIVAAFVGRRGETSLRRAMAEAASVAPVETVSETVAVAPVETAFETREDQAVSSPHGSTTSIVALPEALASKVAPTASGTPRTAISDLPQTAEAQGRPWEALGAVVSMIVGRLPEGLRWRPLGPAPPRMRRPSRSPRRRRCRPSWLGSRGPEPYPPPSFPLEGCRSQGYSSPADRS
ncbi:MULTISPECIES: hypothetical protein [Methylobacteriaceae]|uniref:hypothetical protein n=1 Tax=Methylobacteriaceae TaxID=119045 RepID=UPI00116D16A2|nr:MULTISPECIES: hypothetical protein [Methylobacteriaceae]GEL42895.1 hypothetical protein MEX01_34860 [Methylorubrum extorquens]